MSYLVHSPNFAVLTSKWSSFLMRADLPKSSCRNSFRSSVLGEQCLDRDANVDGTDGFFPMSSIHRAGL